MRYVRAGNTAGGMTNVTLLKDGKPMRYFPVAAGDEVSVAAAAESPGTLILDICILEVSTSG